MSEYISREEGEKAISLYANPNIDGKAVLSHVSSADVRPNVHGHWEKAKKGITAGEFSNLFKCSCCNYELYDDEFNFCPNCGADMREPKGEKGTERCKSE